MGGWVFYLVWFFFLRFLGSGWMGIGDGWMGMWGMDEWVFRGMDEWMVGIRCLFCVVSYLT